MYSTGSAALEIDRKRLRTSVVFSLVLWTVALPLLSLLRYEGPVNEPSMNPVYIELEPLPPQPETAVPEPEPPAAAPPAEETRPERIAQDTEEVEIAEETSHAAAAPAPSGQASREGAAAAPVPEPAAATPSLRPDPSAPPVAARRTSPSAARGGGEPFAPLSEDALRAPSAPPAAESGTPPPQTATPAQRTSSQTASSGPARSDAFDRTLRRTTDRLAAAPAGTAGTSSGSGGGASSASKAKRADMDGNFDFGEGGKRELLSPRRINVPDRLLAGLPETVTTMVSFKIEAGGTVYKSSILFDPPLPDDLASYLRTAFSGWQFSFADSDGQVVFRYSIKVR